MSKYVMVDTISMFRMRYVVEVPDDVGEMRMVDGTRTFPITAEEYAKDSVTCEDVREFSQEHLDEVISSCREVTLEEAVAQWREDNGAIFSTWTDEFVAEKAITEVGFKRAEYEAEEERKYREAMDL